MRRRDLLLLLATAMMAARGVSAQQKAVPVVGLLADLSPTSAIAGAFVAAFRDGLGETGFVEGQNLAIEYRWAEGRFDRLTTLASDLVERKVDVIATAVGMPAALAAKSATAAIPIVFSVGVDPVALGLVAGLARPGSNLTGVTTFGPLLDQKRLELLSELLPQPGVIAILTNPSNAAFRYQTAAAYFEGLQEAARARGVELHKLTASTESEIDAVFAMLVQLHVAALIVGADPLFNSQRDRIVALAARHAVPAIFANRYYATAGGLMSYGPKLADSYRQAGIYAGRILKGDKPGDLPVQQPTKFELVVNFKTAETLGLTIPPSILARADEVIE